MEKKAPEMLQCVCVCLGEREAHTVHEQLLRVSVARDASIDDCKELLTYRTYHLKLQLKLFLKRNVVMNDLVLLFLVLWSFY